MNKEKILQTFLQNIGIEWFKTNFSEKLTELKTSLLELPSGGADAEMFWKANLDIQTLNKFVDEIRKNINDLNSTDDIDIFIKKYATNQAETQKLMSAGVIKTPVDDSNFTKLTEIILGTHVSTSLEMLKQALDVISLIENKIGTTTKITEINPEDLEYILVHSLDNEIQELTKWCLQHKEFTQNNQEELKILKTSTSILEISEACHTIEHLFMNFISDYLSQQEKNNDYKQMLECNIGVELSELLLIKSTFCEEIYKKFKEEKTHQ